MEIVVTQVSGTEVDENKVRAIAEKAAAACFAVYVRGPMLEVLGSGFHVPEGVMTAKHVVDAGLIPGSADMIPGMLVHLRPVSATNSYPTALRWVARDYDLAVLEPPTGFPELSWSTQEPQRGAGVIVLAAPGTLSGGLTLYAASGKVLATSTVVPDLFRYSIPVQPGSSGGPVLILDDGGSIIGINLLQERRGDSIEGQGMKASTLRAVLAGKKPEYPVPVLWGEGATWWDMAILGAALSLGIIFFRSLFLRTE